MQFSIVGVSGDELLAGIPDNVLCHTDTADVTIGREADGSPCLIVASVAETLPDPQAQPNRYAANAARAIRSSREHIEILARSSISLQGSATDLRCSVGNDEEITASTQRAVEHAAGVILVKDFTSLGANLTHAALRIEAPFRSSHQAVSEAHNSGCAGRGESVRARERPGRRRFFQKNPRCPPPLPGC